MTRTRRRGGSNVPRLPGTRPPRAIADARRGAAATSAAAGGATNGRAR
ncbi:hypothetical protein [Actinacidiphila oryziradicis]|nr:hypothetical protein [Actinacidiphila oryziradicis]